MKKTRLFTLLLLVLTLLCGIFNLVSCKENAHTHNYSTEWVKDASYHWQVCSGCDEIRNKTEHDWNSGIITIQPTETSEGTKTFTCNTCEKTKIEGILKLEEEHFHKYDQNNVDNQYIKSTATCTQKAVYYYSCSCGLKGTETFEYGEATGHKYSSTWSYNDTHHWHSAMCEHTTEQKDYAEHNWNDGVVTTEPTIASKGVKTFTCEACGKTKTEEIPKMEEEHIHNYNQKNTKADYLKSGASCTQKAEYYYSCACGLKGTEAFEYGNILDHTFTSYVSNNDGTCTKDGTKTATCDICGVSEDTVADVGSATGHTYSSEWSSDDSNHWHSATCEHTSEASNKETHHWNTGVVTKEPTETTEGEKTYTCGVCKRTKVDNIGKLGHIHTYDTEYTYDDNYHWYAATCEHESEVAGKAAHNWDNGVITSKATVYDEGAKLYTCEDCGCTKEEAIAKIASFTVIFYDADNKTISNINYSLNTASSQVCVPTVQAEVGYQFKGWNDVTTGKAITNIDFSSSQINAVYQFKPSFVRIFEVVFADYEGNQLGETVVVEEGQMISEDDLPAIPTRTGYTSKWGEQIVGTVVVENKIYFPIYEVITYTVTFLDAKGGNELEKRTVEYGSFAIIPEHEQYCLTAKLYGFTGWKSSATDTLIENVDGNKIVKVYSDLTLYAVYEESIEEPVIAIHIDGTTVTMSLCMPDNTALYSINMSMTWSTDIGISKINSIVIANPTYLDGRYCSNQNASVHMEQSEWFTYNNKTQTFDFVWGCGSGHCFAVDLNTITINFGVNGYAEITEESFSVLEGSTVVYGENGTNIEDLEKSSITIWFY